VIAALVMAWWVYAMSVIGSFILGFWLAVWIMRHR